MCVIESWWDYEFATLRMLLIRWWVLDCRDQHKPDVAWGVLGKVVQTNKSFALSDLLEVHLYHVRMRAEKTQGEFLDILSAIKKYCSSEGSCINYRCG
jgi:hypothetical protein